MQESKSCRFDPWAVKIPWRRAWQPTPVSLPGESHGQRSLVGYSPWGCKELDTTKRLSKPSLTIDGEICLNYFIIKMSVLSLVFQPWSRKALCPSEHSSGSTTVSPLELGPERVSTFSFTLFIERGVDCLTWNLLTRSFYFWLLFTVTGRLLGKKELINYFIVCFWNRTGAG